MIERHNLDDQELLDRRRRDLENAIDPTVPKTLRGPGAPTESERTAHEIKAMAHVVQTYFGQTNFGHDLLWLDLLCPRPTLARPFLLVLIPKAPTILALKVVPPLFLPSFCL